MTLPGSATPRSSPSNGISELVTQGELARTAGQVGHVSLRKDMMICLATEGVVLEACSGGVMMARGSSRTKQGPAAFYWSKQLITHLTYVYSCQKLGVWECVGRDGNLAIRVKLFVSTASRKQKHCFRIISRR